MVLLLAVLAGLLAGGARAWYQGRPLSPPALRRVWLAAVAFLPQWFSFNLAAGQDLVPDHLAALILVISQLLLLVFAWCNWDRPGFGALAVGLGLNLLVIALNGGFMPISPETLKQLFAALPSGWEVGGRLGSSKNILLPAAATHLVWLSDRFLLPSWFPNRVAFSLGDALIAAGAFWLLWASGRPAQRSPSRPPRSRRRFDHQTAKEDAPESSHSISCGYLSRGKYPKGVSGSIIRHSLRSFLGRIKMNVTARATPGNGFHEQGKAQTGSSQNGHGELSRLVNAAVVSPAFCKLLLAHPSMALAAGYNGELFRLAPEEEKEILSIQATSLAGFAQQLTLRRNGRSDGS